MANADEQDVEVVHSSYALEVVSGWLGVTPEEAFREAGPTPAEMTQPRRQYLGLGAKATAPLKGSQTAGILGKRLKHRIERSRRAGADDDDDGAGRQPGAGKQPHSQHAAGHKQGLGAGSQRHAGGVGSKRSAPERRNGNAHAEASSSDSESEGRAAAVGAGGKRQPVSAAQLRGQLLAPVEEATPQRVPTKRKKKKKQKGPGDGNASGNGNANGNGNAGGNGA